MLVYAGVILLSAASLAFEISMSRIFSVGQFYHFAFMVVSLALLGYGASGSFLSLSPRLEKWRRERMLTWLSWGFAFTSVGAYALTVQIPFDSFRIAHDWQQGAVLLLHYLALACPFFCSGAVVGLLLSAGRPRPHRVYAANLVGSAAGCVFALIASPVVGGEGVILLCAVLAMLGGLVFQWDAFTDPFSPRAKSRFLSVLLAASQGGIALIFVVAACRTPAFLRVTLSPYKSLSYLLQYPDAELVFQRWNSYARVDVVRSASIRGLSGSGFNCPIQPPPQGGLTVDGDDVNYIHQVEHRFTDVAYTDCLLGSLPYRLRPGARALVLEPRGGADVVTALAQGANHVTVAEGNPLIVEAVREQGDWAGDLYNDPRVRVVTEQGRSFAQRTEEQFDVLVISLNAPQRAVSSGAYSLNEDYRYTVQAFGDYLERLSPGGLLVVTRWLQVPPSESIRAFALAVESVEGTGGNPDTQVVALRSYRQMLILVRQGAFTKAELRVVRDFAAPRAFDLVHLADLRHDEVNRHNVLREPDYHQATAALLGTEGRKTWYSTYPFDLRPPTDDRPFFGHYFKWKQVPRVLAAVGHAWQPFGGAGYLVLLILLAVAVGAAGVVVLLPVALVKRRGGPLGPTLIYFGLLGLGFLCVEIPLMQQFILFLGAPAHAMAVVLFSILLSSGVGSAMSERIAPGAALLLLPPLIGAYALMLPALFDAALGAPMWARVLISVASLTPVGLLMGTPFPGGIRYLEATAPALIPWAWAVNGALSVVASVLAVLLALSLGFSAVLSLGAACYLGALFMATALRLPGSPASPLP